MIEKLQQLSERAPDVCRLTTARYIIGEYAFWLDGGGELVAEENKYHDAFLHPFVTGQPALAWLRDALETAIEARGWDYEIHRESPLYRVIVNVQMASDPVLVEAILAALLVALEGEGK